MTRMAVHHPRHCYRPRVSSSLHCAHTPALLPSLSILLLTPAAPPGCSQDILSTVIDLLSQESEPNALLCLKIVTDKCRSFRPPKTASAKKFLAVVQTMYTHFQQMLVRAACQCGAADSSALDDKSRPCQPGLRGLVCGQRMGMLSAGTASARPA